MFNYSAVRTRSQSRRLVQAQQDLIQQFNNLTEPLNDRVNTTMNRFLTITINHPNINLVQEFADQSQRYYDEVTLHVARYSSPDYVPRGDEISSANRLFNRLVNRIEFLLEIIENASEVRTRLENRFDRGR